MRVTKNLPMLRALFWAALVISFIIALLPAPPRVPASDKVQHVVAFALLALLGRIAYPSASKMTLLVGLSAFGALIEAGQSIPMLNRSPELLDWVADTAAVAVVLACASIFSGANSGDREGH